MQTTAFTLLFFISFYLFFFICPYSTSRVKHLVCLILWDVSISHRVHRMQHWMLKKRTSVINIKVIMSIVFFFIIFKNKYKVSTVRMQLRRHYKIHGITVQTTLKGVCVWMYMCLYALREKKKRNNNESCREKKNLLPYMSLYRNYMQSGYVRWIENKW